MWEKGMLPKGKVIVVTGASSGLGKALADALEVDNTVIRISRSLSNSPITFSCDVGCLESVEQVFKEIKDRYGHIDILVNSAGVGLSGATEHINEHFIRRVFDTNYFGTLFTCQQALKLMDKGSRIVNIGSLAGIAPMPFRAIYNSSKAAVHSLSYSIKMEVAPLGIEVSTIVLGAVATEFASNREKLTHCKSRYALHEQAVDNFMQSVKDDKKMPLAKAVAKIKKILCKKHLKAFYLLDAKSRLIYLLTFLFPNFSLNASYRLMIRK